MGFIGGSFVSFDSSGSLTFLLTCALHHSPVGPSLKLEPFGESFHGDTDDDSGLDTSSVTSLSSSNSPNRTDDDDGLLLPPPRSLNFDLKLEAESNSQAASPRSLKRKAPSENNTSSIPSASSSVPSKLQRSMVPKSSPLVLPLPKPRDQMTPEELSQHKHKQRLLRNRHSAQLSRERKKVYLKNLESEVHSLRTENSELRCQVEDLTAENTRLLEELGRSTGRTEKNTLRRRTGSPSPKAPLQNTGLVLFALVFSLGVFCNLSGVPMSNSTSPALLSNQGRVVSDPSIPALPSPPEYSDLGELRQPVVPQCESDKALTEFVGSSSPFVASHEVDTESDDGEPHYSVRDSSTTSSESHIRLTEQNLKQLLDLLQTMQDSETLFSGGVRDSPDHHHYLFSPNGIRFSMPRRHSTEFAEDSEPLFAKDTRTQPKVELNHAPSQRSNSATVHDADPANKLPVLKIWVPTHTLKSTLLRDEGDEVWYPHLEQTDWGDVGQDVDDSHHKMLVIPDTANTKAGINSHRRSFQSGYTEISCTINSLSEIFLSSNGS